MITPQQYRIIDRWISAVETGAPDGDYSKLTIMNDGPGEVKQITFGKHQTTETGGNLKALIKEILPRLSKHDTMIRKFLIEFLEAPLYSCVNDPNIIAAIKLAGEARPEVQDEFFQKKYWFPACRWCEKNGFQTPLAHLVAYDSWVHSGGVPMMLRKRFSEPVPANGGDEITWLRSYVETRHQWLKYWGDGKSEKSKLLRRTIYRTASLMELIRSANDNLVEKIAVNGIKIS